MTGQGAIRSNRGDSPLGVGSTASFDAAGLRTYQRSGNRGRASLQSAAAASSIRAGALVAFCVLLSACANGPTDRPPAGQAYTSSAYDGRPAPEPASAELPKSSIPLLDPQGLRSLQEAEQRYRAIVAAGGWPSVPAGPSFRPGDGDPRIAVLSRRLIITADIPARANGPSSQVAAGEVGAGLQRFQSRHGLRPTGIVDAQTIEALNVTAESRLAQLRANQARFRDLSQSVAAYKRYVLVNIPSFQLEAVQASRVARRHRVIVGRIERPSPSVTAQIRNINFYPFWHVPDSVAQLDLIPHLQKDPDYIEREHIRVLTDWQGRDVPPNGIDWRSPAAGQYKFRQDPGPWNALGLIRLDMPNAHNVYLHDTPLKDLFSQRHRAMSAGCVRVENVPALAEWVLSETPGWDQGRVEAALAGGQPVDIALSKPVPVLFAYVTAWVNAEGTVEFRSDLYRQDGVEELVASYTQRTARGAPGGRPAMSP